MRMSLPQLLFVVMFLTQSIHGLKNDRLKSIRTKLATIKARKAIHLRQRAYDRTVLRQRIRQQASRPSNREGLQLQLQDRRSEDNARTCHERCNSHNVPVVVEKYKLVFFTTPGVAHTEFEQLLRRMSPDTSDELTHIDAYPFETAYAVLRNDSWTKAIFFRSPVKRFVSGYTTKAKEDTDMDLSTFVDKVERGWYHPSEAYWKSQCEYVHLCDAILPFMNFVGDFGNLANDTRRLLERVSAWDTHGFDTEGGWGGSCTTFCGREHESLSNLSNDVLHRIERLLGADMRIIPQHIKAVAKKPTFPHVADPFVDAFYLYDNPEITMNNWTRICEKRSHADHLFVNALQHHPSRTFDPEKATTFVIPTQMYQSFFCDPKGHVRRLKDAMGALTSSKYFLRKRGNDHVLSTFHWQFSRWAIGTHKWKDMLPQGYINLLENVTMLRFEVYGQSKWRNRFVVEPLEPRTMYSTPWELTKRSIVIPYPADPDINLVSPYNLSEWKARNISVWYHARTREFAHGATALRHRPWIGTAHPCPTCDIGRGNIPKWKWLRGWGNSKFCLVIRGDTPTSHALSNAIKSGCIPVIISDGFERVGLPFRMLIDLKDFTIQMQEIEWVEGGMKSLLARLAALTDFELESKLSGLRRAQPLFLWSHPQSMTASAILREFWSPDPATSVPHFDRVCSTTSVTRP